ncbi:betaine aldehyde dehydrogenase [Siminovitchia terrae]|uniref:Aldehyde dehydrogenase n=1 Tax=Siminovitchia terrae TaxID=1914933 RepID=A0ABQ4KRY4_SIMTE|nr:aldehyde dehydrogenase family protein [Siminovitchia terrae]GIN94791.1 betaine aldehyde dehydrogenase [Siminovitchia terrae]
MLKLNNFYNGEWKSSLSGETKEILNPANGETIAIATRGSAGDTRIAVKSARKAFDSGKWSKLPPKTRARYLLKIADNMENNMDELALWETRNNGKVPASARIDVVNAIECFRYYANLITETSEKVFHLGKPVYTKVVHEPVGVCGLIAPWNFPLLMASWKIAPALAAGNTIVFKPAEITPITAVRLFEMIEQAGVPAGVANLVLGPGSEAGNELAVSPEVDKISFTGGTSTGKEIMKAAAETMKKVSLELGGKSPIIVFADADFETAVDYAMFAIFHNQGQVCSAGSRLLLEESIKDRFIDRLVERAKNISIGPGEASESEMGPLVSEPHLQKVLQYIEAGKAEGAKLECGGNRLTTGKFEKGYFLEPTIFTDTTPDMRIVKEEIFGPVLAVQTFLDEKEAITLANDSIYGLAGSVFSGDDEKAERVVNGLQAGITWINTYHMASVEAPWGGFKQSGIGRELGEYGLREFTEPKQININTRVQPVGWFKN